MDTFLTTANAAAARTALGLDLASPGPIGGTTPAAGTFTELIAKRTGGVGISLQSSIGVALVNIGDYSGEGLWFQLLRDSARIEIGLLSDLVLSRSAAATLQLGLDHATTPTAQTIKAHGVTTGTGADLILEGGTGSVADGKVRFGTHAGVAAEVVTGYITIKDAGGTDRKLAVIS